MCVCVRRSQGNKILTTVLDKVVCTGLGLSGGTMTGEGSGGLRLGKGLGQVKIRGLDRT